MRAAPGFARCRSALLGRACFVFGPEGRLWRLGFAPLDRKMVSLRSRGCASVLAGGVAPAALVGCKVTGVEAGHELGGHRQWLAIIVHHRENAAQWGEFRRG